MGIVNIDTDAERFGWQPLANGDTIPEGSWRRCGASGNKIVKAKDDRLACSSCEIWRGCGTPGCAFSEDPKHEQCAGGGPNDEVRKRLHRSVLDASGRVIGYTVENGVKLVTGDPHVNEELIDKIAAQLLKQPDPSQALTLRRNGARVATYEARNVRMTFSGRHFRGDGEPCPCGTAHGASAMGDKIGEVGTRCCTGCHRVDVDRRLTRGCVDPHVACFECEPATAYERLAKRAGKAMDYDFAADEEIDKPLDVVELYERMCGATPPVGTRGYWEHIIDAAKPPAQTVSEVVSALAATFDVGGQFVNELALAHAIFIAANIEEIAKRTEIFDLKTAPIHTLRDREYSNLRRALETMWTDPEYARAVESAKESAARIWKAREVWR